MNNREEMILRAQGTFFCTSLTELSPGRIFNAKQKMKSKFNNQYLFRFQKILESKIGTPIEILCENLPSEFQDYLNYVKGL